MTWIASISPTGVRAALDGIVLVLGGFTLLNLSSHDSMDQVEPRRRRRSEEDLFDQVTRTLPIWVRRRVNPSTGGASPTPAEWRGMITGND